MIRMSQGVFDLDSGEQSPADRTLSVNELVDEINGALTARFGRGVWVQGEIRGLKNSSGPHLYFDIVGQRDGQTAVLNVSFFANHRNRLRPLLEKHRLKLADGLKVRLYGQVDLYGPNGRLGLKMSDIDPRFTLGELAVQRDEIVRRLVASGLYDANKDTEVPLVPLRIGLVTSNGSDAYKDFCKELDASGIGFQVLLADVRVQGDDAPLMVSTAVRYFGARPDVDVIVVVRGGGSKNDLAAFDHEQIAVAIAESPLPVFTGIGHEADVSIADEVAHTRFKTPTACARGLVDHVLDFSNDAELAWDAITARVRGALDVGSSRLDAVAHRLRGATHAVVERADERLHHRAGRLGPLAAGVVAAASTRSEHAFTRVAGAAQRHLGLAAARLDSFDTHVRLLDPVHTLARGWSITRTASGQVVRSVADAAPGTELVTTVADGSVHSTVVPTPTSSKEQS